MAFSKLILIYGLLIIISSNYSMKWKTNYWYKVTSFVQKATNMTNCWFCHEKEKSLYDGVHGYFLPINMSTWLTLLAIVGQHNSPNLPMGTVTGQFVFPPEVVIYQLEGLINVGFLPEILSYDSKLIMQLDKDQWIVHGDNVSIEQCPVDTFFFPGYISWYSQNPVDPYGRWGQIGKTKEEICHLLANKSKDIFISPWLDICSQIWRAAQCTNYSGAFDKQFSNAKKLNPHCPVKEIIRMLPQAYGTIAPRGYFWVCGKGGFKILPGSWKGSCTLAHYVTPVAMHKNLYSRLIYALARYKRSWSDVGDFLARLFLPGYQIVQQINTDHFVHNLSMLLEADLNITGKAIVDLQEEMDLLARIVTDNRIVLDSMLAEQGGVCVVLNHSCCMYVNNSGLIEEDVHKIYRLAGLTSDARQSWEKIHNWYKTIWDTLTSWIPFGWLKSVFVGIIFIVFFYPCCLLLYPMYSILSKCLFFV